MTDESHEMLIRLDTKMEYVKEGVDHLKKSQMKLWEKSDEHGIVLASHTESISVFKKVFWIIIAGLAGVGFWIAREAIKQIS